MIRFLFLIYQWLIAFPILLVITTLTALVTIIGCSIGSGTFWGYFPAHIWSKCICTLWCVKVRVVGRENINKNTSYVFVSNHQGAFDIWALSGYLDHNFKWLMKASLEKIFLVGFACKKAGYIFVDDTNLRSIKETIKEAESTLQNGMSLVIFPEGSRTWDGKMIPFKRGAFMLASEFGLPVVPLTIDGAFQVMPRSSYNVRPGTITITIHEPVMPDEKGFNTKVLMAKCREKINSSLPDELKD